MSLNLKLGRDIISFMHTYEFMFILRPEVEVTEKKAKDMAEKLLAKVGGKLTSVTVWGKKVLAYPISKATEGTYVLAIAEGSIKSGDLEKEIRMDSEILRFMLIAK